MGTDSTSIAQLAALKKSCVVTDEEILDFIRAQGMGNFPHVLCAPDAVLSLVVKNWPLLIEFTQSHTTRNPKGKTMKYTIRVTEDDIRTGLRGDFRSCPIALAINRQTPFHSVEVGMEWWYIDEASHIARVGIPIAHEAQNFIERFDDGYGYGPACEPFTFELELPEESA